MPDSNPLANQGSAPSSQGGGVAPTGLRQTQREANPLGNQGPSTYLGRVAAEDGLDAAAQGWYTGANQTGIANGWDDTLIPRFLPEWNKALEEGTAADYFNQADATGIVTWDHTGVDAKDGVERERVFGDIYDNGEYVGNIYKLKMEGFDEAVADQVMSHLVLGREQKNQISADDDRTARLHEEIQNERENRTESFEDYQNRVVFQADVDATQEGFQEAGGDVAVSGAAALTSGFLAKGLLGARVPGPPQLKAAATVGFGIYGGVSAWMNRDALSEQLARSYNVTKISFEEENAIAGIFTGINQFGGFGAKLMSPTSNLVQGITDVAGDSRAGDGKADFYRTDDEGQRTTSRLVRGLDVAATVGDSLLQFASPLGLQMYTAQMTSVIGGEVGELAFTGGKAFDYRSASFDNVFTDDDGNFDLTSAAAGIGKVGIDVVQLGMARGLAAKVNAAREGAEQGALYRVGGLFGRSTPAGTERVRGAGWTFLRDKATGGIVEGSKKWSLGMLAPSEQLASLSARVLAVRTSARNAGALTADDFYRATQSLAAGERKVTTTLVNAMGEGYEEGIQSVFEQHSFGHELDWGEIGNSALYGFAAGAGMGLGYAVNSPNADARMFAMANAANYARGIGPIDRAEWDKMTQTQKVARATTNKTEKAALEAAFKKRAANMAADFVAGTPGAHKWLDAYEAERTRLLGTANDRINGAYVITQIESAGKTDVNGDLLPGEFPADAAVASGIQVARLLDDHLRAEGGKVESLTRDLAEFNRRMGDPNDPAAAELGEMIARTQQMLDTANLTITWGQRFQQMLDVHLARIYDSQATVATIDAEVAVLNRVLLQAFRLELDIRAAFGLDPSTAITVEDQKALARAVSALVARDPHDQAGSYQLLVPQVSGKLSAENSDNVLEVSHAILGAIRGDYDGDKVRPMNELILTDEQYEAARIGQHFVGAGVKVNVGTPKWEPHNVRALADALRHADPTMKLYAEQSKVEITNAIRRRYSGVIEDSVLDEVFESFYELLEAGEPKAREALLNGLAREAGAQLTEFSRNNLSNEYLWLDNMIVGSLQRFQTVAARYRPIRRNPDDTTSTPIPRAPAGTVRERALQKSVTLGNTLDLMSTGVDPFRQLQGIHYSVLASPVLSALGLDPRSSELGRLALQYRELGTGITRAEIEEIHAKDEITARVLVQLRRLSRQASMLDAGLSENEAMAVIANLKVLDFDMDVNGVVTGNSNQLISLTQFLLKQSIKQDQHDKAAILEASPELQAKHARLNAMVRPGKKGKPGRSTNAQKAFAEVVGSMQLIDLVGESASEILGPQLTVEQFIRLFTELGPDARTELKAKLENDAAYLDKKGIHDMPFDLADARAGRLSPYRAVIDTITAVGNGRISIDTSGKGETARGKLSGDYVDQDRSVTKEWREGHKDAHAAVLEFVEFYGREEGESLEHTVQRLLEQHPDFAARVYALIPNAVTHGVIYRREDGEFVVANWVFKMLAMENSVEAEMVYWRELFYARRNAMNFAAVEAEAQDENERATTLDSMRNRIDRLVYSLAKSDDGGMALERFFLTLEEATDADAFFDWLNNDSQMRMPVPLLRWVDDVALFDADKAGGGWTTSLEGAELREAMSALKRASRNVLRDIQEEREAMLADVRTLHSIQQVVDFRNGVPGTAVPSKAQEELADQLQARIDQAGEMGIGLGPQAMIYQVVFAAYGFYPSGHTKGQNPPHLEALGSLQAMQDAYGYISNYNRVMAALTSTDMSAVGQNMSELARGDVRTMDEHGRPVEWRQPTVEGMLKLLSNPSTRAMARSILYPQVIERGLENQVTRQSLVGKSVKDFLDGTSLKEMFPQANKLSRDSALRYVSMLETVARQYGGHFSVQRWANEIVIAKTTGADHVLTIDEIEGMAVEALHHIARVMQKAGAIAAENFDPDADPFEKLYADTKLAQRKLRLARSMGYETEDKDAIDTYLQSNIAAMEREAEEQKQALAAALPKNATLAEVEEQERRNLAIDRDRDVFVKRLKLLMENDQVGAVVEMLTIPEGVPFSEEYTAHQREVIRDFVLARMDNFTERATQTISIVQRMTQQLDDPNNAGQIDLEPAEWQTLSRATIAIYLDEVNSYGAGPVALFPDADKESFQKYWDSSFAYLAEPALDREGPILQAAVRIHRMAGRQGAPVPLDRDLVSEIGDTILRTDDFGSWTSDVPRATISAHERIDSSAASVAISIYGQSPKTEAVFTAATKRTFETNVDGVDIATLLSKSTLTWEQLDGAKFDDIGVTFPDGSLVQRPLVELNNRFASTVRVRFKDKNGMDQDIDLLGYRPQIGQPYAMDQRAVQAPYTAVNVYRIKQGVHKLATDFDITPGTIEVDIEYFHPDTKPAGPAWANNLWFEGTAFQLDADHFDSLNGALWFANESISPAGQAAALDATKLGKPAMTTIKVPTYATAEAMESGWDTDLAGVLRAKTREMFNLEYELNIEAEDFWNAVHKNLKLRHLVRGYTPGTQDREVWTADQVIAHQIANPGVPLPLDNAQLWIPSDEVLRSMLGEQGSQGVLRAFDSMLEHDLSRVPRFREVTPAMMEAFAGTQPDENMVMEWTNLASRSRQQVLQVHGFLDNRTRSIYAEKIRYYDASRIDEHRDRGQTQSDPDKPGFNANRNLNRIKTLAEGYLESENIAFDWGAAGIYFIGPRDFSNNLMSQHLIQNMNEAIEENKYRTGWEFVYNGIAQPDEGTLTQQTPNGGGKGQKVVAGDIVVIRLDSFEGNTVELEKWLQHFADKGALLIPVASDSQVDMRDHAMRWLLENDYSKIAGSKYLFRPAIYDSRYRAQQARMSTLTAVRAVSPRNYAMVFHVKGLPIQENAAWAKPKDQRLGAVRVGMNLLPLNAFVDYNAPVTSDQKDDVRAQLRAMDNDQGRAFLREMSNQDITIAAERKHADEQWDIAWNRMMDRFDNHDNQVLPQAGDTFGTGDMIPLVNTAGRILLYRHGHHAPKSRNVINAMQSTHPVDAEGAVNIATYTGYRNPAATTHTGRVVQTHPRSGFGMSIELDIDLQQFGDKVQLEFNGMKYVIAPTPDNVNLHDHGVFENWDISLISDFDSLESKEGFDGLLKNHRTAFMAFGVDFAPYIAEFFYPGEGQSITRQREAKALMNQLSWRMEPISDGHADQMMKNLVLSEKFRELLEGQAANLEGVETDWVARLGDGSVPARIALAMLIYLSTPGGHIDHVWRSGGFNDTSTDLDAVSIEMPRMFTQVFDMASLNDPLRIEMNQHFNRQLNNPNRSKDGSGYVLNNDFSLEVQHADRSKNMVGYLQIAELHSSGDNPLVNGMSFDLLGKQQVSHHSANIAYQATGAQTATQHDIARAKEFFNASKVRKFETEVDANGVRQGKLTGGVWEMLSQTDPKDRGAGRNWRVLTPGEQARVETARGAMTGGRTEIDKTGDLWAVEGGRDFRREYKDLVIQIRTTLHLRKEQDKLVDFWVRQVYGEHDRISGKAAIEVAKDILDMVSQGYLPTISGEVPLLHIHDLQAIYRANRRRPVGDRWLPKASLDPKDDERASKWADWVRVSIGGAFTSDNLFDTFYLLWLDGIFHGYQNATSDLIDLPVTMDSELNNLLLHPDTGRMLVSIDPDTQQRAAEPGVMDMRRATLEEIIAGNRMVDGYKAKKPPASEIAKKREKIRQWRKSKDMVVPVGKSLKDLRKNGIEVIDHSTRTNTLVRMLIHLRVGTALINPALYASMGPEMWMRGALDRLANAVTLQGTTGRTALLSAGASEALEARVAKRRADYIAEPKTGADFLANMFTEVMSMPERMGIQHRYTRTQLESFDRLFNALGDPNSDFGGMMFKELMFIRPEHGHGRLDRWLANYAKFGSKLQDPTYGMRQKTLGRRYVEGAMQHILALPTLHNVSVDTIIAELMVKPTFLQDNFPDAHKAGLNNVAQIRSLKQTTGSAFLRGIIEPLSDSSHGAYNFAGNVFLKLPFLFANYASNVATSITGMQGLSDMTAAALTGRNKGFLGRMQTRVRGRKLETDDEFNFDDVLEGIDLTRSFIRAGLTHTGLFVTAMMAGGIGLFGEDDEARRRRLLAENQGLGVIYDPRDPRNSFLNADAIYLDWLPFGLGEYGSEKVGGIGMYQPHWMFRWVFSPMMGIDNFIKTGDVRHVQWGFEDAISSFPIVNTMMWKDAVETGNQLADMAAAEAKLGGDENIVSAGGFLTTMVANYERMLFESAFVNSVYVGRDRYDRDPYLLALRDAVGEINTDIEGQARPNNLALSTYVDPATGEVKQGYMKRNDMDALLHSMTENRFTLAAVSSLVSSVTGLGDTDYFRYQMPIKTREFNNKTMGRAAVEETVLAQFVRNGGAASLTIEEAEKIAKKELYGRYEAGGEFPQPEEIEARTKELAQANAGGAAFSVYDEFGYESLSEEGAKAVYRGLLKKTVAFGDESLQGVYVSFEMRQKIAEEWSKEITQEGINLGLDHNAAATRMKRIMGGPFNTDEPGLSDLLFAGPADGGLGYDKQRAYKQLNTTYVQGPDGNYWATGWTRDGLMGALGMKPFNRQILPEQSAMDIDISLNSVDLVNRANLGLRALELLDKTEYVPTDKEIGDAIIKAIEDAAKGDYTPYKPFRNDGGGGGGYGGGYGGGGGGKSYGYPNFTRAYPLPTLLTPYGNSTPFINTSNPILRRASVRRERVWSERGRLKQWQ